MTASPPSARRLEGLLGRFARAREGVAAVEFALVVTPMFLLFLGASELAQYLSNARKVTLAARTVADLTARETGAVSQVAFDSIRQASRRVLAPFDSETAQRATFTMVSVGVYAGADNTVKAKVCSSTDTTRPENQVGAAVTAIPDGYKVAGFRYLVAEVTMTYPAMLGKTLPEQLKKSAADADSFFGLKERITWPVRNGTALNGNPEVVLVNGGFCSKDY